MPRYKRTADIVSDALQLDKRRRLSLRICDNGNCKMECSDYMRICQALSLPIYQNRVAYSSCSTAFQGTVAPARKVVAGAQRNLEPAPSSDIVHRIACGPRRTDTGNRHGVRADRRNARALTEHVH